MFSAKLKKIITTKTPLQADTLTPILAYRVLQDKENSILFESMEGSGRSSRFTVIGFEPLLTLTSTGDKTEIKGLLLDKPLILRGDPYEHIRSLINFYKNGVTDLFTGGFLAGYLSYGSFRHIEAKIKFKHKPHTLPEAMFILPGIVLRFDNFKQTLELMVHLPEGENTDQAAGHKLKAILEKLTSARPELQDMAGGKKRNMKDIAGDFSGEDFINSVVKAKNYIREGDIFQAVLSRRKTLPYAVDPLETYRRLRVINPSPYMYLLEFGDFSILGASPETMVKCEDEIVTMRPIAGTRHRGQDREEEQRMAEELINDEKELAEHDMLVDLGRNDVGRVSKTGSVKVPTYRKIEYFSHVMHIVSTVTGERRKDKDNIDVFRACFPAGTVSGAPKIRAVEIIDELEPQARGPYAGAIGYFDFADRMDTCIAIRTLVIEKDKTWWQAGAGIVADSDPNLELKETENKGKVFVTTLMDEGE